jgi:hypothetical protein
VVVLPTPAHETHDFSRIDRKGHIAENVAFAVVGVDLFKLEHGVIEETSESIDLLI